MKLVNIFFGVFVLILFSCKEGEQSKEYKNGKDESGILTNVDSLGANSQSKMNKEKRNQLDRGLINTNFHTKNIDSTVLVKGLVDIKEIEPSIKVDLKYATSDNFMHKVLYTKLKRALLQRDVALRLAKVQEKLKSLHPSYSLLIYDAARPVSVQQKMWNALDTIPVKERGKFVSNPANRSLHNFGAAIDLTIVDGNGKPLDMGAGYDDIRKIAYPSLESKFLASGELTKKHIENRKLLRSVMESQGFRNIPSEWWHFNACSRDEAKKIYEVLMEEPNF